MMELDGKHRDVDSFFSFHLCFPVKKVKIINEERKKERKLLVYRVFHLSMRTIVVGESFYPTSELLLNNGNYKCLVNILVLLLTRLYILN